MELFISIHFNSYNKSASGVETLVYRANSDAYNIGSRICDRVSAIGFKNRGVKIRPDLYVIKNTTMSAVLVECCFIDSASDIGRYDYKTMASAIVEGVIDKSIESNNTSNSDEDNKDILYRVCIGSYRDKNNANMCLEEARNKGYKDAFIY